MGLDGVELVMNVEETFGFSIPDGDAVGLVTVGELYDYILEHRFKGRQDGCLTSVAFYKLRCALTSVLGIARSNVRVSSELTAIIPNRRRRIWRSLQKAIGLRLPKLVRPVPVWATSIAVSFVFVIAIFILLFGRQGVGGAVNGALVTLFACSFVFYQGTKPLAVAFQSKFATVGGLTKCIVQMNYGTIFDGCQRASEDDIWRVLREIIVEQLGVPPEHVTKEARFVEDLGIS
jgi:acyl carrier protein